MATKAEWKACAERRLVENLALRALIEEMSRKLSRYHKHRFYTAEETVQELQRLVHTAKEIGK